MAHTSSAAALVAFQKSESFKQNGRAKPKIALVDDKLVTRPEEFDLLDGFKQVRQQLCALTSIFDKLEAQYQEHIMRPLPRSPKVRQTPTYDLGPAATNNFAKPPEALLNGSNVDVMAMLHDGELDPNLCYENFRCLGKDFITGTPLAIAVLRGKRDMVHTLVTAKAHPDSEYSFAAGAEQQTWSGTALHAAVPSGNLDMIKELVKFSADINATGSNGANMIWQAAYFGQAAILEYLLECGVEADLPAQSQDNSLLWYTPLHAAAIAGHGKVVQLLLSARARHTMDWDCRQPLEDAIKACHADVVKQLMVASSDIFSPVYSEEPLEMGRSWAAEPRCIDFVFDSDNPVLLAQVAKGLSQSSRTLEHMNKADFIHFLCVPGEAPNHVLDAIFQPFSLRYWDEVDSKRVRKQRTAAFVETEDKVNIVEGPHYRVFVRAFNTKQLLPSARMDFLQQLLPQEGPRVQTMFVPVTCYMCHIPMLHKDLQVLLAIADCNNLKIFGNQGCQAIINLKWRAERRLARLRMLLALVEVLVLFVLNIALNYKLGTTAGNVTALCVWFVAVVIEAAQMIGYAASGLTKRYFTTLRYWFDLLVLLSTGSVNLSLLTLDHASTDKVGFRTAFGVLTFLKWMRFLTFLRQLRSVGLNILPITTTMWDVVPFGLVLSVYLIGSVNLYFALGINPSLFDSFMLVYRLVVLGDLNVSEFENLDLPTLSISDHTIVQTRRDQGPYYFVIRVFIVFVSFVMGLTMMNLFVAILCLSYSQAAENAWYSFMRSRANIVLDQHAVRLGINTILCRRRTRISRRIKRKTPDHASSSASLDDERLEAQSAYIWFAVQADARS